MQNKLINIVHDVLNGLENKYELTEKDVKIAEFHKIDSYLYSACDKTKTSPEVLHQIKQRHMRDIQRDVVQLAQLEKITDKFEEEGLDCIPLKGSVMKSLFPYSYLRFMGDLDILIHQEDMKRASKIMNSLGYRTGTNSYNHLGFEKPPLMEVELHRDLLPFESEGSEQMADIWNRVHLKKGKAHTYEMKSEDFLLFMLFHLYKHYSKNGTGIRSFIDLYIYQRACKDLDFAYVDSKLSEAGILEISHDFLEFSKDYFDLVETKDKFKEMEKVIYESGVFGLAQFRTERELKENHGNKFKVVLRKIFPSAGYMIQKYRFLEHKRYLLPIFYVGRVFKLVFIKPFHSLDRVRLLNKYDKKK